VLHRTTLQTFTVDELMMMLYDGTVRCIFGAELDVESTEILENVVADAKFKNGPSAECARDVIELMFEDDKIAMLK